MKSLLKNLLSTLPLFLFIGTTYAQTATDNCANAPTIVINNESCGSMVFSGNLSEATPETFDFGCGYAVNPTVWYKLDVPDGLTFDISLNENITYSILSGDCSGVVPINECLTVSQNDFFLQGPDQYYLVISSPDESEYLLTITVRDIPENDDPYPSSPRPPHILSLESPHESSTCCALGFADGANADLPNVSCSNLTHDGAVWYHYTTGNEEGFQIILTPSQTNGITGHVTIEVLSGSATSPSGSLLNPTSVSCGPLPTDGLKVGCIEPNTDVWIKIASAEENCGNFTLTIAEIDRCPLAEECSDAVDVIFTNPTNAFCGAYTPVTVTGCLEAACPETEVSDCGLGQNPTVWFKVAVDEEAVQLSTSIQSNGTWKPVWGIYYGGCGSLSILSGGTIADPVPCSNGDANESEHVVGTVTGQLTYWIAVSGEGVIDDPTFTLNVWTSANCISCLGGNGCDPTATFTVLERSTNRALDDPKFCEGEEVKFCIDFKYDSSESAQDWFHGLIPDFGPGWDLTSLDQSKVTASPSLPEWVESGSACSAFTSELLPLLCTYVDPETGKLKVCNTICEPCPCSAPLYAGSMLPDGWFWSTNGGAVCLNDCSPSTHYGIGSSVVDIQLCMTLRVKTFANQQEKAAHNNLQIKFQTFSDGVVGCKEDPLAECKLDKTQLGPSWVVDTLNANYFIAQDTSTIVGSGKLNINFTNFKNYDNLTAYVTPEDNPFVSGEKSDTFYIGRGAIRDSLINLSDSIQIVKYHISAFSDVFCMTNKTIYVVLYPTVNKYVLNAKVFADVNNNDQLDPLQESLLSGFKVFFPAYNYSIFTNSLGELQIRVDTGLLDMVVTSTYGTWATNPIYKTINIQDTVTDILIGFVPIIDTISSIPFLSGSYRCSTPSNTIFGVKNTSSAQKISGKLTYFYDGRIDNLLYFIPQPDGINTQTNTAFWNFSDLAMGGSFNVNHGFVAPAIQSIDDSLDFKVKIIVNSIASEETISCSDILSCAFDPNDKRVIPDRIGNENYVLRDEDLQYHIRFQNVGNDTAYNVVITDVIDDHLDQNSIVLLYASHQLSMESVGDTIYFKFVGINLPDSTRSHMASNGFVLFSISPKADIQQGTEMTNEANIYFDNNAPILTNKTKNTIVDRLPCPQDAIFIDENDAVAVNQANDVYQWYSCADNLLLKTTTVPFFYPAANGEYYCVISGYFCDSKTKCVIYDKITSTTDFAEKHIKIYPNPGSDFVSIAGDKSIGKIKSLKVYDTNGKEYLIPITNQNDVYSLDTSALTDGIYIFSVVGADGHNYNIKWVKL
jgi:uncharacterized repeat protein (TIGR01451 family)